VLLLEKIQTHAEDFVEECFNLHSSRKPC